MAKRVKQEHIERWLDEFRLEYERAEPANDEDFRWALVVTGGQAFKVLIAQRNADFNYVAVQATIGIADKHQAVLLALSEDERKSFIYDLRRALVAQQAGYTMNIEFDESGRPTTRLESVTLGTNMTEETIERADFFKRNHAVQTAAGLVLLMVQRMADLRRWP